MDDTVPSAALPERMKPLPDRATEGRVNPKGIPCLYLAADEHTAIAEVRPWIGSLVSVGLFRTVRPLRVVDCSQHADRYAFFFGEEPTAEQTTEAVWCHVDRAFREPVTRNDDVAEYAPTQIIAERFRTEGLDGIGYCSAFGSNRYNVALFGLDAADLLMCTLYEIEDIQLKYSQRDNPYYIQHLDDGTTTTVRNVIVGVYPLEKPN